MSGRSHCRIAFAMCAFSLAPAIPFAALGIVPWAAFSGTARLAAAERAEKSAPLRVENVRRVFHNGEHNAFTDLCRFGERYFLTFRSCPDGHGVSPTASVIVLASDDLQTWDQVLRFQVPRRDTRDPHFLVFQDRLFVYTGTWYCGDAPPQAYDMNQQLGYAVWTEDGKRWHGPRMLEGTYGHYIWRAAAHAGKAYLCGRRKRQFAETASRAERDPIVESALLESDDGLVWKTRGLFQTEYGNETAFLFEPDGSLLAVARSGGSRNAQLCLSAPPYNRWQRTDLDRYLGGPMVAKWGSRYLVGGRDSTSGKPVTTLYWLHDRTLQPCASLPSGGDNSYTGFLALDAHHGVLSYYSSHERDAQGQAITAIYLADLIVE